MDDGQKVRMEVIITREAHGLLVRTGGVPPLHQLDIHVRTASDYDQRLDIEPAFTDARFKMMERELEALHAFRG